MNLNIIVSITGIAIACVAVFVAIGNSKRSNAISLYQPRREKLKFLIEFFGLHEILEHVNLSTFAQAIPAEAGTESYPLTWRVLNMLPRVKYDGHLIFGVIAKSKEFDVSFVVNKGLFSKECESAVERLGNSYMHFITQVSNCYNGRKDDGLEEKLDMFRNELREFKESVLKQMVAQMTKALPKKHGV